MSKAIRHVGIFLFYADLREKNPQRLLYISGYRFTSHHCSAIIMPEQIITPDNYYRRLPRCSLLAHIIQAAEVLDITLRTFIFLSWGFISFLYVLVLHFFRGGEVIAAYGQVDSYNIHIGTLIIYTVTHHPGPFVNLFLPFYMLRHFVNGIVLPGLSAVSKYSAGPLPCLPARQVIEGRVRHVTGEKIVVASKSQCAGESCSSAQSTPPAFNLRSVIFTALALIQYTLTLFLQEDGSKAGSV